jgi:hypothetical protein
MNHFAARSLAVYNNHLFPMKKSTGKTVGHLLYLQIINNYCKMYVLCKERFHICCRKLSIYCHSFCSIHIFPYHILVDVSSDLALLSLNYNANERCRGRIKQMNINVAFTKAKKLMSNQVPPGKAFGEFVCLCSILGSWK